MRPIEFRAWDNKYKKMIVGYKAFLLMDIANGMLFNTVEDEYMPEDRYVLMQFTSLLDRNSKKVFEGDISLGEDNTKIKVFWHNGSFIVDDRGIYFWLLGDCNKYWEVIGNIYENPELLREAK